MRDSYDIKELAAETDHSQVYLAVDKSGKEVILKRSKVASDECDFFRGLQHPNFPQLYDFWRDYSGTEPQHILVKEFIKGHSLWVHFNLDETKNSKTREKNNASLVMRALEPLKYIHGNNQYVGDLKPDDFIVQADTGKVYLVDVEHTPNNQEIARFWNKRYSAPEIVDTLTDPILANIGFGNILRLAADCGSDIYSMGLILAESLVTHCEQTVLDFLDIRSQGTERFFREHGIDISPSLLDIITKATAQHSGQRYYDVEEFRKALRDFSG